MNKREKRAAIKKWDHKQWRLRVCRRWAESWLRMMGFTGVQAKLKKLPEVK